MKGDEGPALLTMGEHSRQNKQTKCPELGVDVAVSGNRETVQVVGT